eukprot:superscaffoldBa00000969_g8259
MNLNDFVVLPNNKAKSVKLNARNLQELQMKTVTLAQESKEMEEKLQQLKESMSKEKEERGHSGGFRWKSGQCGSLNSSSLTNSTKKNKENTLQKLSAGKVKIRLLKDEPLTGEYRGFSCALPAPAATAQMCAECTESYCVGCFAKFHQKGALKLHRMIPIQVLVVNHGEEKEVEMTEDGQKKEDEKGFSTSLLGGEYDEEDSARSFQEALRQWRGELSNGEGEPMIQDAMWKPVRPVSVSAMATQADLSPDRGAEGRERGGGEGRVPIRVEFMENSLTYMDRLILKKHRRFTAQEEDFHRYCASLFAVPVSSSRTEPQITTTESCLIIEVLDETDRDTNGVFVAEQRTDNNI